MKILYLFLFLLVLIFGCRKDDSISSDSKSGLYISADTVFFDTVFTTIGSTTRRVKIFNRSGRALKISEIKLIGGSKSAFHINLNGTSGHRFSNFEIPPNDSVNLFVKVSVDPNLEQSPFIVTDSILFSDEGKLKKLYLRAYGQNAHFVRDAVIDENTTWDSHLPFVLLNSVRVNKGKTLTITAGSKVYFHKDAGLTVNGSLRIEGDLRDSIILSSDRRERIYAEEPGQWKGIYLSKTSKDNFINHATIQNALIGIHLDSLPENNSPKLLLTNSVIKNMEIAGIAGDNTRITAFNNIFTNCGKHLIYCTGGGSYNLKQNTFSNLNYYFSRTTPAVYFNDVGSGNSALPLQLTLINNIIWGSLSNELIVEKNGNQLSQVIRRNLIKSRDSKLEGAGNILNQDPLFFNARNNNFHLLNISPAANIGEDLSTDPDFNFALSTDKQKNQRTNPSDLGCYEIF